MRQLHTKFRRNFAPLPELLARKVTGNSDESAEQFHARIGQRIRKLRQAFSLSQHQMGVLMGVSYQQVQKYEAGANRVSTDQLWRLARYFDISVDFLVQPDGGAMIGKAIEQKKTVATDGESQND